MRGTSMRESQQPETPGVFGKAFGWGQGSWAMVTIGEVLLRGWGGQWVSLPSPVQGLLVLGCGHYKNTDHVVNTALKLLPLCKSSIYTKSCSQASWWYETSLPSLFLLEIAVLWLQLLWSACYKVPMARHARVNKTQGLVEKVQCLSLLSSLTHILRGPSVPSLPVSRSNILPATAAGI